jgi:hypothetical protein
LSIAEKVAPRQEVFTEKIDAGFIVVGTVIVPVGEMEEIDVPIF